MVWRIAQGLTEAVNCLVEAPLEIDDNAGLPDPPLQLFPAENSPWPREQCGQNFERLLLQRNPRAALE